MLTCKERLQIKKICRLSDITVADILACVDCHRDMINNNDYHKASVIRYVLYTILKQNASNTKILSQIKKAIYEVNSYASLFAYEDWKKGGELMQAVINNKLYDTDTAVCICEYIENSEYNGNCFALYRTDNGNYFFEGTFGLEPCTKEEAKEYFLENVDGKKNCYEDYAEEFGDDIERA